MKRITYLIFLASMAGITSCSKQLDQKPVSDISGTTLFLNANDFLLSTNGAYSKLKTVPTNWMLDGGNAFRQPECNDRW